MGKMRTYFVGKLFDINYRMATHEGDAKRRLASEAVKILLLPSSEVPESYRIQFLKLRALIEDSLQKAPIKGLTHRNLGHIHNSTAVKYIKLLLAIQGDLHNE